MLDAIESLLARWTGRVNWPITTAKMEDHLLLASMGGPSYTSQRNPAGACDFYSYEVDGQVFISSVREIEGRGNVMGAKGNSVPIRYNPRKPSQSYYAPACQLASRLVVVVAVLCAVTAIAFFIYRPQR